MQIISADNTHPIIIIGEGFSAAGAVEPFTSKAGSILKIALGRFKKSVRLIEIRKDDENEDIASPENMAILKAYLGTQTYEKLLVLGAKSVRAVLPESFHGKQRVTKLVTLPLLAYDGKQIAASLHPSMILQSGGVEKSDYYEGFKERLISLITSAEITPPDVKVIKGNVDILDDVLNKLEKYTGNIGFDYETNAEDPWSGRMVVSGAGFAVKTKKNGGYAWYIDFLDKPISDHLKERLKQFLLKNGFRLWAYNAKFEMAVTWDWLGAFVRFQDAMVLCIQDHSPGSLKNNSRRFLHASLWEEEVRNSLDIYGEIFKQLTKYPIKETVQAELKEPKIVKKRGKEPVTITHEEKINKLPTSTNIHKLFELDNHPELTVREGVTDLLAQAIEQFGEESARVSISRYPYEWAAVDPDILGEYCGMDSYFTLGLMENFLPTYKGSYHMYISQMWLAGYMEGVGLLWDDGAADDLHTFYLTEQCKTLVELIQYMDVSVEDKLKAKEILSYELPYEKITYTEKTKKRKVANIDTEGKRLTEIKDIFNPNSNVAESRDKYWNAYNTEDMEIMTVLYSIDQELRLRGIYDDVAHLVKYDNLEITIDNLLSYDDNKRIAREVNNSIVDGSEHAMTEYAGRFANEIFGSQYEIHRLFRGVNAIERDTWNTQMEMLFLLRKYKKMDKSRSTYIEGSVGRGSVYKARINLDNLQEPPLRLKPYKECSSKELKEDERWIMNSTFKPMVADTKRWSSPQHTVPSGCDLRGIYATRLEDSFTVHADYSQMELCIVAVMANDRNLIDAFLTGRDIHRFVASKVFNKPESEITSEQRRYAKACSFAILYGASIASVARDMMGGDIDRANQIFSDFFGQFPGILQFIKDRHEEALSTGIVHTLYGDVLRIDPTEREDRKLRISTNAPIQSSASSLAGFSMWRLTDSCLEKGIPMIPLVFTHDSLDSEVGGKALFKFIKELLWQMQDRVYKEFGIPARVDWELGVTQNLMLEIEILDQTDSQIVFSFEGNKDGVMAVVERLKKTYDKVDYVIEKEEQVLDDPTEMFTTKRAFSRSWGEYLTICEGKIRIIHDFTT